MLNAETMQRMVNPNTIRNIKRKMHNERSKILRARSSARQLAFLFGGFSLFSIYQRLFVDDKFHPKAMFVLMLILLASLIPFTEAYAKFKDFQGELEKGMATFFHTYLTPNTQFLNSCVVGSIDVSKKIQHVILTEFYLTHAEKKFQKILKQMQLQNITTEEYENLHEQLSDKILMQLPDRPVNIEGDTFIFDEVGLYKWLLELPNDDAPIIHPYTTVNISHKPVIFQQKIKDKIDKLIIDMQQRLDVQRDCDHALVARR